MSSTYYDLKVLEETAGGDKDFINQMIRIYLETAPDDFEALIEQCRSGDIENAGKTAHKMKSAARSMGMFFWETLLLIEQIGKGNEPANKLDDAVMNIEEAFPLALKDLKAEL